MYKDEVYSIEGDVNMPSLSMKLSLLQEGWIDLPDSTRAEESAKLKVKIEMVESYLSQFETSAVATDAMLKLNLSREDAHNIISEYWNK